MDRNFLKPRNLRASIGPLIPRFPLVVSASVLALAACHGCRQKTIEGIATPSPEPQHRERCATDSLSLKEAVEIKKQIEEFRASKGALAPAEVFTLKLYFHVITGYGEGNVTDDQINQQMTVLNQAYASTHFQFYLAGRERKENPQWFKMTKDKADELEAKTALGSKQKDVVDVYTANIGPLGWALPPSKVAANPYDDGVVILFSTLPGGDEEPYNQGKTLVHEVGHWLGLLHTFEGGCSGLGDLVGDTPAEAYKHWGCAERHSCPGQQWDAIHNLMDYSDDSCAYEFTPGQWDHMDTMFALYRKAP